MLISKLIAVQAVPAVKFKKTKFNQSWKLRKRAKSSSGLSECTKMNFSGRLVQKKDLLPSVSVFWINFSKQLSLLSIILVLRISRQLLRSVKRSTMTK